MSLTEVRDWLDQGESETLEFKKSTAELQAAFRTLCGFLNASGGTVVIGIAPDSKKDLGQQVSDHTLRHIAEAAGRIEPPTRVDQRRVPLGNDKRDLIVLSVQPQPDSVPFTFEGK